MAKIVIDSPEEKETTRIPSPRAPLEPPTAFHQIKHLRVKLTPRALRLCMEPRIVLQMKRAHGAAHWNFDGAYSGRLWHQVYEAP